MTRGQGPLERPRFNLVTSAETASPLRSCSQAQGLGLQYGPGGTPCALSGVTVRCASGVTSEGRRPPLDRHRFHILITSSAQSRLALDSLWRVLEREGDAAALTSVEPHLHPLRTPARGQQPARGPLSSSGASRWQSLAVGCPPPPRLGKGGNRRDPPGVAGHRPCRWGDGAIFPNPQSRSRHRFSSTVTPAPPLVARVRLDAPRWRGRPPARAARVAEGAGVEGSSLAACAARMARTPADGVPVDPVPARPARGHGHWTLSAARRPWTSAPSPNKPHGPLMVPRAAHPPFLCFH